MKKSNDEEKKFTIKFIISIFLYVIFFIYEVLEKVFNWILLHIKFVKSIIVNLKEKLYSSKFYSWSKTRVDKIDEKSFLVIIAFLIISSGLMIYVLPFVIKNSFLKLISIIVGKILSTLNIVLNSIGIKKIFKIPFIRYLRMRINKIKRDIKAKLLKVKAFVRIYIEKIKTTQTYQKIKEFFKSFKKYAN